MDTLLENLYWDVMRRCWEGSSRQREALQEWNAAKGTDWDDICDAAQVLAERQSLAAFLAAFHLGYAMEHESWQQLEE